jgi:membrane-associated phospholipid phosphatase
MLLAAGGAMWGLSNLAHPEHRCPCSPMGINGLDRGFAGEPIRKGADTASNVLNSVTLTVPFLIGYLDRRSKPSGSREFKADAFILGETLLLNEGLNSLVKNLVGRPRPFAYGLTAGDPALTQKATYTSFYSAHTSSALAVSMAYGKIYARHHPNGRHALVYGIGIGVASTTAALRVRASKHFPTDVLVGAASGIAIGLTVPGLHD